MATSFLKSLVLILLIGAMPLWGNAPESGHILFLMHTGDTDGAITHYHDYAKKLGHHDLDLIQQMSLALLDQGFRTEDPEIQVLTLFGAGTSLNERTLYILEEGARSKDPQLQLLSLNFLNRYQTDSTESLLARAMSSKYLLIRLEAIFLLAQKKHPQAVHHAESLMPKVPKQVLPLFPQIFAAAGTDDAMKVMRRMLSDGNPQVRIAAIVSAVKHQRDDLLPQIRRLAMQHDPVQEEACAVALGAFRDETSVPLLESLAASTAPNVKVAALQALIRLERKEVIKELESVAMQGDIFAITTLGEIEGTEETLLTLTKSSDIQVRINATLALLQREESRCLEPLCDVLIRNSRDLAFHQGSSAGKSLTAYKVTGSATQNFKDVPLAHEMSFLIRENALCQALELPEKDFLMLADLLFESHQNDLVPTLVHLLENLQTPDAISLLKKHQQKAGAPLIRSYCNLALYRLKEPGPYEQILHQWVLEKHDTELIRFRPILTREAYGVSSPYQLNPHDTSRLLVESFETLAKNQNEQGINILLEAIQHGNNTNKYALAGLLMRAAQ